MFSASMAVVPGVSYPAFDPSNKGAGITLTNSNRTMSVSGLDCGVLVTKAIPPSSDKYWEVHIDSIPRSIQIGIALASNNVSIFPASQTSGWAYVSNGAVVTNSASIGSNAQFFSGDTVGVRYNSGTGVLTFYLNGVLQPYGFTGLSGTMFPICGGDSGQLTINFGPTMAILPSGASLLTN